MRLRPVGRLRHLVGLGLAGAVIGHGLTVAWISRGSTGPAAVLATGHAYWASWGGAAVATGLAAGITSLLAFGLTQLRSTRSDEHDERTLVASGFWLAAFQVVAFVTTEVLERVIAQEGWSSLLSHRVLVAGVVIQFGVAALAAQGLRLIRRAVAELVARQRRPVPRVDRRRWAAWIALRVASLVRVGLAPSRAPPGTA
jgi:hypothetical protein